MTWLFRDDVIGNIVVDHLHLSKSRNLQRSRAEARVNLHLEFLPLTLLLLPLELFFMILYVLLLLFAKADKLVSFEPKTIDADDMVARFDRFPFVASVEVFLMLLFLVFEFQLLAYLFDPREGSKTEVEDDVDSDDVDE